MTEIQTRDLCDRIEDLLRERSRIVVGLCGPPGVGKSHLASVLVDDLRPDAVVMPMDGFHLAWNLIAGTELADRRGAPDTFDADGYVRTLQRVVEADDEIVYVPEYRREIEDPIACAIAVTAATPVVITEGNYLLLNRPPWNRVRSIVDEVWYLQEKGPTRRQRLIDRHAEFGASPADAIRRADGSDQRNAALIEASKHRADAVVECEPGRGYSLTLRHSDGSAG